MVEDEATVDELREHVALDRSTITRHLNYLAERGFVTKDSKTLSQGGRVNVYVSRPPEDLRQKFVLGLFVWLERATDIAEDMTEEKIEAMLAETAREVGTDPPVASAPAAESTEGSDEPESTPDGESNTLLDRLLGRTRR